MKLFRLFPTALLLGLAVSSYAQQSYYVPCSLKKVDCVAAKAEVQAQVCTLSDQTLDMGKTNYRYEQGPLSIRNPKVVNKGNLLNQANCDIKTNRKMSAQGIYYSVMEDGEGNIYMEISQITY
jgi:hypothetical protein